VLQVRIFWPDAKKKEVALRMRDVSGQWVTASNPFQLTTIGTVALATSMEEEVCKWVGWLVQWRRKSMQKELVVLGGGQ